MANVRATLCSAVYFWDAGECLKERNNVVVERCDVANFTTYIDSQSWFKIVMRRRIIQQNHLVSTTCYKTFDELVPIYINF